MIFYKFVIFISGFQYIWEFLVKYGDVFLERLCVYILEIIVKRKGQNCFNVLFIIQIGIIVVIVLLIGCIGINNKLKCVFFVCLIINGV